MHAKVLDQLDGIPEDIRAKAGIHGPGSFLWEIDLFRGRIESPLPPPKATMMGPS